MRHRPLSARFLLAAFAVSAFAACSEDEPPKLEAGTIGTECDPESSSSCNSGLECSARAAGGNVCTYPAGAGCKPDSDLENGGCAEGSECAPQDETSAPTCGILDGGECDPAEDHCAAGLSCSEVASGGYRCYGEIILRGDVQDATDQSAIEGAHVMAVDEEGVAVTGVAVTDAMGNYELEVPAVRNDDGTPVSTQFTLRSAAQNYQAFPSGVRVALPIDVVDPMQEERRYVVENALTEIDLIPLEAADRSTISGSIVALDGASDETIAGVLVVATGVDGAFSGISDKAGNFTIFNVPAGDYTLQGYAVDVQIESDDVTVTSDPLEGVELAQLDGGTTTVSGTVQIVNATGEALTSVILVVEDTFDAMMARGEVPRGLRAPRTGPPDVSGAFSITGVPVGQYIVLAAYENDGLVRDPDTNIAGTDFVSIEVMADQGELMIAESFKVTEALGTVSPGAEEPEAVTESPLLTWVDDSSEAWYDVRVFDALGNEVWTALMLPPVTGSDNASVQYEGPLDPGMYYQFRVTAWRQPGMGDAAPISTTEDLRGVFFSPGE
jgi:hypothetical protein